MHSLKNIFTKSFCNKNLKSTCIWIINKISSSVYNTLIVSNSMPVHVIATLKTYLKQQDVYK